MLISDIHLRDYHRFNKTPQERLKSFVLLAKEIVKIGKQQDVDTMLIGGDIVDKNTLSPAELHTLFSMFTILAKHFRIYSVIGNHDAKSKKDIRSYDTVVTLLEDLDDNITFHHQEILEIGGRKIAFENWMPEYDLSWIEEPVDLYLSHATIDYDQTGMYGMDTSVFKDKFTYGVFGDIHVNRQIENFISIGNTKQESLSDRHQGGVMIMDLEDLSYKRIPIDPDHKMFLHLTTTEVEGDEGWVDREGNNMTYKIYRPKRIKGKVRNFEIPKVTDIDSRTNSVMKTAGLVKLHKTIKDESVYEPIDFNFSLTELNIENFRSIRKYKVDLTKDYNVTGIVGSGKSSLILALYYSMIGNKSLKNLIKIGHKFCRLKLTLSYQGIEYVILRGTDTGDYGLKVGNKDLKFNTKAEFEKSVMDYLPFLKYHESFFFNSWAGELLGSLKVDKRYEILAKYYRLDSLASYNEVATNKYKLEKKSLKELEREVDSIKFLSKSRKEDVEQLEEQLKDQISEKLLDSILAEQERLSEMVKTITNINSKCRESQLRIDRNIDSINSKKTLLESLKKTLNTSRTKEDLREKLSLKSKADALQERIDKGEKYLLDLKTTKSTNLNKIEVIDAHLKNLGVGTLIKVPDNLETDIDSIFRTIEKKKLNKANAYSLVNTKIKEISIKLENLKKEHSDASNRLGTQETCECCGQDISHEDLIKKLNEYISNEEANLSSYNKKLKGLNATYKKHAEEIEDLEKKRDSMKKELSDILDSNLLYEKNLSKRENLNSERLTRLSVVKECEDSLETFTSMLNDLKKDLKDIPKITSEEVISYTSDLRNLELIQDTETELEELKTSLKPVIEKERRTLKKLEGERDVTQKILDRNEVLSEEKLSFYKDLKYKYNTLADLQDKYEESKKATELKEKAFSNLSKKVSQLEDYCDLTSRSGVILKSVLEDLTRTFSSTKFKFSTSKALANGKQVNDFSVSLLVGKNWIPYEALSSGQKTLCDLYYLSKTITGVGTVVMDETLKRLDDETLKEGISLIDSIKKTNIIISSHSSNLSMEGTTSLRCDLANNTTTITEVI
jgi:DNA repair exonuclease SbcCD ATPase subunit/predicted phosphodiesterase